MSDILASLAGDHEISDSCNSAQQVIDELLWNRKLLRESDTWDPYLRRMSGYATASLDGAHMPTDPLMEPDASPMGELSQQGLVITAEADRQVQTFRKTPLQVWARLSAVIGGDEEFRGKPRTTNDIDDPLHLGSVVPHELVVARSTDLSHVVLESKAPALMVAAIVHAELATIRPFVYGSYLVARASVRLVLASRELDAHGWIMPEFGMHRLGRASYVRALNAYSSGTMEGMREWMQWHNSAMTQGVRMTDELTKIPATQ